MADTYIGAYNEATEAIRQKHKPKKKKVETAPPSNNFSMPQNLFANAPSVSTRTPSQVYSQSFNTKTDLAALKNVYNPGLGNQLASNARQAANSLNSTGKCAKGVVSAMVNGGFAGDNVRSASAYQIDAKLAQHKNFKEVTVSQEDLRNLPAGCTIVWQPSLGHPNGHIAVTQGDGSETSDHINKLIVRSGVQYSVFVPVGVDFKG
ncbi:MAG: hypothetical protein WCG95_05840 [bacterium]